jgi:hypothetical protein
MSGIDPIIFEHEVNIYPGARIVRQHLRAINPRKALAIKAKVDKLLNVGFIYLVPLNECVSNSIHVNKKQGTICVRMDF